MTGDWSSTLPVISVLSSIFLALLYITPFSEQVFVNGRPIGIDGCAFFDLAMDELSHRVLICFLDHFCPHFFLLILPY